MMDNGEHSWTIRRVENLCAWGDAVQMVVAGPTLTNEPLEVVPAEQLRGAVEALVIIARGTGFSQKMAKEALEVMGVDPYTHPRPEGQ